MDATFQTEELDETQETHWVGRAAFPLVLFLFAVNQALLGFALYRGWYWLAALLVLTLSHLMHGLIIGLHEASHGLLRNSRRLNEIDGILLGAMSFMSFSLYRAAHQSHHAHLATERDEELWPFVVTRMPRWRRVAAAFLELNAGLFYTPYLFFRTFWRADSPIRNKKLRRRINVEIAFMFLVWSLILAATAWLGAWKYFLWMYLAPAYLAGNLQSWRKYIEHVGLTGSTVNSSTRSIVSTGLAGRLVSFTLLHEPYHGVHHRRSGLPHAELPGHVAELEPRHPGESAPFPSYWHALLHLFRNLPDPRVGAQWRTASSSWDRA
jgi:fatty acid desaturase